MMPRLIPNSLRTQEIKSYQDIYFRKYGEHITDEEAEEQGLKLLRFLIAMIEYTAPYMDDDEMMI